MAQKDFRDREVKFIGSHAKIDVKTFLGETFCFHLLCFLVKKKGQTKRYLKETNLDELLHSTPWLMAAELEEVKDSVHEAKDCTAQGQMQSSQMGKASLKSKMNSSELGDFSFCTRSLLRSDKIL